jgi:prepilin-type N-terminal cleavage/methylation domain-containing protein
MWNRTGADNGFTIMEMLVAIAITVLLMGLILAPIIQTFAMTRQTNAMVQAQDTARVTLESISRELGQAMYIVDNSNSKTVFPVVQADGSTADIMALYARVDIQLPKLVMHCNSPDHPADQPRDYERGDDAWPPCPVDGSEDVEARPKQPLEVDGKIVRYFIGLKDNDTAAQVPYPARRDWPETDGPPDNGFILYRAEFDLDANTSNVSPDPSKGYNLFPLIPDPNGSNKQVLSTDDPYFFYNTGTAPNGKKYWENWKAVAAPVVPQLDMDLIKPDFNQAGDKIVSIIPSVRFQLSAMTNDAFSPAEMSDLSSESPTALPTVCRATYGAWGTSMITDTGSGGFLAGPYSLSVSRYDPNTKANDIWYVTHWNPGNGHMMIDKQVGANTTPNIFDITAYQLSISAASPTGQFPTTDPEIAFVVDPYRGEVRFDFPASDTIGNAEIITMNRDVHDNFGSFTIPPTRSHRMSQFTATPPTRRIVPGSEIVTGPDMTPGTAPGQARRVRYERVPWNLGEPGRNQYKINYGMTDSTGNDVGWIVFSPAPDEFIPETMYDKVNGSYAADQPSTIDIGYRFQCNRDGDVVIGSYSTKTLLGVTLGIRYYDSSGKLQPVELTNKVRVRNLMR